MTETRTLDLDDIVRQLKEAGLEAYVEQTGGGTATILAGDEVKDGRALVAAGPGWFEGPGWTNGRGDTADFYVGPDDQGVSDDFVRAGENWDEAEVVREIRNQYASLRAKENFARAQIDRLAQAATYARDAWEAIDGTAAADALTTKYPKNLPDFNEVVQALTVFAAEVQA